MAQTCYGKTGKKIALTETFLVRRFPMAFLECRFFSESLGLSCSMNVILPQATRGQIGMKGRVRGKKHPVLVLLHGMSDDHTTWARRTSIERYAADLGLAVIMPAGNLSWYQDMVSGPKYATFFREELLEVARGFFPLSDRRQDNFIAGLSMGGYGALYLALSQPERYAAAASLSGAVDVANIADGRDDHWRMVMQSCFGDFSKIGGGPSDLFAMTRKLVRAGKKIPAIYSCCGLEDYLLPGNQRFAAHAAKLKLPFTYEEHDGFSHNWDYWDQQIQRVLQWLPLKK